MEVVLEGEMTDGKYRPSGLTPAQEFDAMVRLETALVERQVILRHEKDGELVYDIPNPSVHPPSESEIR
jgi:hypothetical protein